MSHKKGFTLIEVLIVVAILAILTLMAIFSLSNQRDKATDAKSKADLARLKIAFEDYYNDHNCYPPDTWFDNADDCGTPQLAPYLAQIPCDPRTGEPYVLETDGSSCGDWFKLYAQLTQTASDPSSLALCGPGGSSLGTYGVSSSNTSVTIDCSAISTPSSTPVPTVPPHAEGMYSCTPTRTCDNHQPTPYASPSNCKVSFDRDDCYGYCATAPDNMLCSN